MLVLILLIAMLFTTIAVMSCAFKKMDVVYLTVIALFTDTLLYGAVSEILYWIKKFTIARSLIAVTAVAVIALIILLVRGKRPDHTFSIRRNIIPFMMVLIVAAVSITVTKSGYFGLDDSVGVIQSKAMKMDYEYYIYGLSDETYYEQVYDQAEYDTMKQVLAPYEERCNSANSAMAAIMAVMARMFGYKSMNHVYAYLGSLAVYMIYIIAYARKNRFNQKYGNRRVRMLVSGVMTLLVSCMLIAVYGNRSTVLTWDELADLNSITGGTSAYVIDQSMIGDYYIPVKCLTLGCTLPEVSSVEQDIARFYNTETMQLNQCANFNYITSADRFTEDEINGYALSTAYTGNYVLYRNIWSYYYDGNYVKKEVFPNIIYLFNVMLSIAALTFAYGRAAYIRHGKSDIVLCGMKAIATAAVMYTITFLCYMGMMRVYPGGVFESCSEMSMILIFMISVLIIGVTDRKRDDKRKLRFFKSQVNRVSVAMFVAAVAIAVIFTIRMDGLYTLMDGRMGRLQADAVTLITGNTSASNIQLNQYTSNGIESLLVAWFVLTGSIAGHSRMMYAYGLIAIAVGCACAVLTAVIAGKIKKEIKETTRNIAAGAVSIAAVCIVMTVCTGMMGTCTRLIPWDVLNVNTSDIKSTDVVVADQDVNPLMCRAIQAVQGVRIISYTPEAMSGSQTDPASVDMAQRVAAVEKKAGAAGNQIYYLTSQPYNDRNNNFMQGNTIKEVDYNDDVYQKYSTVAKNAEYGMYRIDKTIGRREVVNR